MSYQGKRRVGKLKCVCGNILERRLDYFKDPRAKHHCGCKDNKKKDELIVGKVFGYLTILEPPFRDEKDLFVHCQCKCGNEMKARGYEVLSGETVSCGCYNKEILSNRAGENHPLYSHGKTGSSDFLVWPRATTREKYGVDFYAQTEEFKERAKKTCRKNFGVDCPAQSEEVREKAKETNMKKFGVPHHMMSKERVQELKKKNLEEHGYEWPSQRPEVRNTFWLYSSIFLGK